MRISIEPEAHEYWNDMAEAAQPGPELDMVASEAFRFSTAISLKRIADALEHLAQGHLEVGVAGISFGNPVPVILVAPE